VASGNLFNASTIHMLNMRIRQARQFNSPSSERVAGNASATRNAGAPRAHINRRQPALVGRRLALTPALSPSDGERVQQNPVLEGSNALGFVDRRPTVLPLPTRCDGAAARRVGWGEGRGEGKPGDHTSTPVQKLICAPPPSRTILRLDTSPDPTSLWP
jgi:hypothetical protein